VLILYKDYQLHDSVSTGILNWDGVTAFDYDPVVCECGITSGGAWGWGPWIQFFVGHVSYRYAYRDVHIMISGSSETEEGYADWVQLASSTAAYCEPVSGSIGFTFNGDIYAGPYRLERPVKQARAVYVRARGRDGMPAGHIYRLLISLSGSRVML